MDSIDFLTEWAPEEGTYIITATFTDEDNEEESPESLFWSLRNSNGEIVNDKENIEITPSTTISIVLSGDDLTIPENDDGIRFLTITGTYNSSLGMGLPLTGEIAFNIKNFIGI